jgi:hypothetical protein
MLEQMRAKYREIRREVYTLATMPSVTNERRHVENQRRFKTKVEAICNDASLANWNVATPEARQEFWHHLWTKNRYAGIRSQIATTEITHLTPLFDNYHWFSDPGWDLESKGHMVQSAGALAKNFFDRSGPFTHMQTIGNVPKLKKIVAVARAYTHYFDEHPDAVALDFVTRELSTVDTWALHAQLLALGYRADLTALHFMMDTGFQVIKPDVVISRLFLDWGWLHYAIPKLPSDLSRADLEGKGRYGGRYLYTKPTIYRPAIDLARRIVEGLASTDLAADIGWVSSNPIREFDLFVVKAGQLPECDFGIERRLYA